LFYALYAFFVQKVMRVRMWLSENKAKYSWLYIS
jgi:hypothetical protein